MKIYRYIELFAILVAYALAFVTLVIWTWAYLNGEMVTLTINEYGERRLEFYMWIVLIPIMAFGLYRYLQDYR